MVTRARDGRTWRIGTDADVAWIANGTSVGRTITAGIPPVFDAYATVVLRHGGTKGCDAAFERRGMGRRAIRLPAAYHTPLAVPVAFPIGRRPTGTRGHSRRAQHGAELGPDHCIPADDLRSSRSHRGGWGGHRSVITFAVMRAAASEAR